MVYYFLCHNRGRIKGLRWACIGLALGLHWACVGSMGVRVGSVRVFEYQLVGISNAKVSRWAISPSPNARSFVLQWIIGLGL